MEELTKHEFTEEEQKAIKAGLDELYPNGVSTENFHLAVVEVVKFKLPHVIQRLIDGLPNGFEQKPISCSFSNFKLK